MPEALTLEQGLAWVISGGGAAVLAYFLVGKIPQLAELRSEIKRYVSIFLTSVLAVAAWAASVGLGYTPLPIGWQGWLEGAFAVAFAANLVVGVIHGRRDLRQRDFLAGRLG
jgi:hypothetical protein